jgi:hypothetical protein
VRGCRRLGLFHADAKEECRWRLDLSSHRELVSRFLELYRGDGKDPRRSLRCVELFWDDLLRIEAERMLRARHERDVVFVFDELLFHRIIMNFLWHEQGAEAVDELLSLAPRSDIYVQVGAPAEIAMSPVHERDRGRRDARQVQRYEDLNDRALHHIGESGAELIEIDGRMPPQRAAEMLAERLPAIASARQSERRLSPGGGRTAGAAPALRLTGGARRP